MANPVNAIGFKITRDHLRNPQSTPDTRWDYDHQNKLICPISLDELKTGDLVYKVDCCKHVFKKQPLEASVIINPTCPMCRRLINIASLYHVPTNELYDKESKFIFSKTFLKKIVVLRIYPR